MIPVGLTLQPERAYLSLLGGVIERDVDYYEVAPETMWRADAAGALHSNGFRALFASLGEKSGRPFVAHGVGFSVGSSGRKEGARKRRWLARLREDHADFKFLWYTDHLGASTLLDLDVALPMPLLWTADTAAIVRRSLALMQSVVPDVGVENTVTYFALGDPLDEPAFLRRALSARRTHLLLDLHNVYTTAKNAGFDPADYIARLDLDRVIEIHLSGGSDSDPRWLPSGRVLRLDAHDTAIPEDVFALLESVAPRCPNLRGVTVERMEGTVAEADVAVIREEIRRARRILRRLG